MKVHVEEVLSLIDDEIRKAEESELDAPHEHKSEWANRIDGLEELRERVEEMANSPLRRMVYHSLIHDAPYTLKPEEVR